MSTSRDSSSGKIDYCKSVQRKVKISEYMCKLKITKKKDAGQKHTRF